MNERDLMQALEGRAAGVDPAGPPTSAMIGRADTLRKRRTAFTAVATAAAVAVVATTVSLVGVGGDRSTAPEVVSPGGLGGTFGDALAVLPAGTRSLAFTDRAAAAERLGLDATTAQEYADDLADYGVTASGQGNEDPGGLFTPLSIQVELMADLPLSDLDVAWAVSGSLEAPSAIGLSGFTVYRVAPGTDLDAVADDLVEAGLEETALRGRRHLVAESPASVSSPGGFIGDGYPRDFVDVTVDTEEDLLIVGGGSESVLAVLDGELESASDAGTFDTLLDGLVDLERVGVSVGAACFDESPGLQEPVQTATVVYGAPVELAGRLLFPDAETAAADLEARTAYFETGPLGEDAAPLDDYGTYEVTRDGALIDVELDDMGSETMRSLEQVPGSFLGC